MKICIICKLSFGYGSNAQKYCKNCSMIQNKLAQDKAKRKYRESHRGQLREKNRQYYNENKIKITAKNKIYRVNNAAYIKQYRDKHKTDIREYYKKYYNNMVGYLRYCYHRINTRCNNPKIHNFNCYGGRGIKNMFN